MNKSEVTIHQVNFVLQRTPGIHAELIPEAKKAVVERLIDQEVLVQQAVKNKLDQDPETLAALEAARREVLSRRYLERTAEAVGKPDPAAIKNYYDEHPVFFKQRRVYTFNEIVLPSRPANWESLEPALVQAKTLDEAGSVLRGGGLQTPTSINVVRAVEELPLELVPRFAQMKTGEVVIYPLANAIVIGEIRNIRPEPLSLADATPSIERFLMNQNRNVAAQNEVKRLRAAAEIAYLGEFVASTPQGDNATATPPAAPASESATSPTPADDTKSVIDRGLKGLK